MNCCGFMTTVLVPMKANLSLYNAIFNIWMLAIHPPWHIRVTSVDLWTNSCQFPSCLALKTIPFCFELAVTFFPTCVVLVSIRCIKSEVACTFRSICRRKALDFLRLFGDGYFKERGGWLWPILPDRKIMKESWRNHKKRGQRQDLHFNLVCRLSRKLISAASISLLFICTDCHRDFMRTSSFPCFKWKQSQFRGITRKKQLCFWHFILRANSHSWVGIYRLNHNKFVDGTQWNTNPPPHFLLKTQSFYGLTLNGTHKKLNQPKMVVSHWMWPHRVVWSVSDRASVCRHTYFASSTNESLWALTLECANHINTCAAILAWIVFCIHTFVNVWENNTIVMILQ